MAAMKTELNQYGLREVKSEEELSGMTYLLDEYCKDAIHLSGVRGETEWYDIPVGRAL